MVTFPFFGTSYTFSGSHLTALRSILAWRITGVVAEKELQVYRWHNPGSVDSLEPSISRTRIRSVLEAGGRPRQ
jgi:hypothetical protein